MGLQGEVQLVRDSLESLFSPTVATSVLFAALSAWGRGVPGTPAEVLELVRGPLRDALHERIGAEADPTLEKLEMELVQIAAAAESLELDIDFDDGPDEGAMTAQMMAVTQPVGVLVLAATPVFARRLTASIGIERIHALSVADVPELRHTVFSANPLILVVDAADPPTARAADVAKAIRALPDAVLTVVWGEETSYGKELRARFEQHDARVLFLDRKEGTEPLHDLVLSRYKTATLPPPTF